MATQLYEKEKQVGLANFVFNHHSNLPESSWEVIATSALVSRVRLLYSLTPDEY